MLSNKGGFYFLLTGSKYRFQAESDSKNISALDLDFSSFESIRAAAKKLTDDYESGIDILVNCASAGLIPCEDTNDGFGKNIALF